MYEQFFSFSQRPFSATPAPENFVASSSTQETLNEVKLCLTEGRGIALLTAPSGMGKTIFCRQLLEEMKADFQIAFLANAHFPTRRSFLQTIIYEFGHGYIRHGEEEVRIILKRLLKSLVSPRSTALLVIDEADHLSKRMLDEVRSLSNIIEGENQLLRILLCGPHSLEEKFALPENSACYQRVACQATLEPLSIQESVNYVNHRIQRVGSTLEATFLPDALDAICQASDGLPRALNQLCDHSLMLGYLAEQSPIDLPIVLEALDDLKQLPLCWNEPTAAKQTYTDTDQKVEVEESVEIESTPVDEIFHSEEIELTSEQPDEASFEVGSFEVGADITYEAEAINRPEPAVTCTETQETVEVSSYEATSCIEIIEPLMPVVSEGEEANFEIGAEVIEVQETIIPLETDCSEEVILTIAEEETEPIADNETDDSTVVSQEANSGRSIVEIIFDRYALIDAGDSVSSNCINLSEAIAGSITIEKSVEQDHSEMSVPSQIENKIETITKTDTEESTETEERNSHQQNEIRDNLIQVCQETRKAIGHQLDVLEEIWETSNQESATKQNETYELEKSKSKDSVQTDILTMEATAEARSIDLAAMRQRLSQRFKQLRRKQG